MTVLVSELHHAERQDAWLPPRIWELYYTMELLTRLLVIRRRHLLKLLPFRSLLTFRPDPRSSILLTTS